MKNARGVAIFALAIKRQLVLTDFFLVPGDRAANSQRRVRVTHFAFKVVPELPVLNR